MNENNINNQNINNNVQNNVQSSPEVNSVQNSVSTPVNNEANVQNTVNTVSSSNNVAPSTNTIVQNDVDKTSESKLRIGGKKVTYSLDDKGNIVNSKSNEKKESKSVISFVIVFFGLLLVAVFLIPNFYQTLHNTNLRTRQVEEEEDTSNLIDGKYIELGTKAHITDKNTKIKFNNFKKETQRAGIQFDVKAETSISNVSEYNLAIKIYDKDKNVIHISKFAPSGKVETSVKRYYIHLIEEAYKIAQYVEVTTYDDNKSTALECSNSRTSNGVKVVENIKYNFTGNMLSSYTLTKEATVSDAGATLDSYKTRYKEEYNNLLLSNIDSKQIKLDNAKLTYTIDLLTFKKQTSTYDKIYEYGDVYDFVKKIETASGKTCK